MSTEQTKLQEVVDEFDTVMLVTQETSGALVARPMAIAEHNENDGTLVFSTSSETGKVTEIRADDDVAVVMQSSNRYVSLSGTAEISNDRDRIRSLFKKDWEIWFPEGPEQSDLRLIVFKPASGEYWDLSGTKGLKFLWQASKALFQEEGLEPDQHDKAQHGRAAID